MLQADILLPSTFFISEFLLSVPVSLSMPFLLPSCLAQQAADSFAGEAVRQFQVEIPGKAQHEDYADELA